MSTTTQANGHQGIVIFLCLLTAGLGLGVLETEAAAPEGKGKNNATAQAAKSQGKANAPVKAAKSQNPGKAVGKPATSPNKGGRSNAARARQENSGNGAAVVRQHPHQDRGARNGADRNSGVGRDETRGRPQQAQRPQNARGNDSRGNGGRGREAARERVEGLLQDLNRLERARWSHNPHDERGQGNVGQPRMRDPYGHDKDSGREGRDRGRPIRESEALNLAELVTVEMFDPYLARIQDAIAGLEAWLEQYGETSPYADWRAWALTWWQQRLEYYVVNPRDTIRNVLYRDELVEYSLMFDAFEGMNTTTLQVTTQLVSTETVSVTGSAPDETGTWERFSTTYEAGQVMTETTEDIALSEGDTFTLSLNPSDELLNGGFFFGSQSVTVDVVVTITDPASGASYTMTLDQQIRLVDPYGIVYDKMLGTPIAGAVVTVHNANGSVAVLDKAGNANVSNPQMTDATGRYSCKLVMGKYYLTVKATGYEEYRSPLFSEQGHIVRVDAGLTALGVTAPSSAATEPLTPPVAPGSLAPLPGAGVGSSSLLVR